MTSGRIAAFAVDPADCAAIAALCRAGVQFRARNGARTSPHVIAIVEGIEQYASTYSHPIAAHGSEVGPAAAIASPLEEIDTDQAGALLGLTANRVRQLLRGESLAGRQVAGGRWLTTRQAIRDYKKGAR